MHVGDNQPRTAEPAEVAEVADPAGPVEVAAGSRDHDASDDLLARRHRNQLLARLPADEDHRLAQMLHPVSLRNRDTVERQGQTLEAVYFPIDMVLSVVEPRDDTEVEITTIGNEGVAGMHAFLGATTSPYNTFSQVPGSALRLTVPDLRRFLADDGALHRLFRAYAQVTIAQLSRNVICHQLHRAEQRAARWLLTTHDRVGTDDFFLTQEFLAQMLGVRRMTVSEVASRFQQQNLFHYSRGRITITDRAGLETTACDCYDTLRGQVPALLDEAHT